MKKLSQEEAEKVLEGMKVKIEIPKSAVTQRKRNIALDMAIEALKYSEVPNSSDCISRQAVDELSRELVHTTRDKADFLCYFWEGLQDLPPVNPHPEIVRCNQCKYAEVADSEDSQDGYTCQFHRGSIWFSGSYCSWAERRQDG